MKKTRLWPTHLFCNSLETISVRPGKFQILEQGQNRNFDQKSEIYSLDLGCRNRFHRWNRLAKSS